MGVGWGKSDSEQLRATWMVSGSLGCLKSREEGKEEGGAPSPFTHQDCLGGWVPHASDKVVMSAGTPAWPSGTFILQANHPGPPVPTFSKVRATGVPKHLLGVGEEGASPGVQGNLLDPRVTLWK